MGKSIIRLKNVSKFYYSKGVIASGFTKINLEFEMGEFVAICNLHTLLACINEEGAVVLLCLLEHHNASGYACAKEEVVWQLDNSIHIVVVNEVLPYLLLSPTSIHHTREAYY